MLRKACCYFLLGMVGSATTCWATSPSWSGYALGEGISNLQGGLKKGSVGNGAAKLVANFTAQNQALRPDVIKIGYQLASCTQYQSNYTAAIQSPSAFLAPRGTHIADLSYEHNLAQQQMILGVMDLNENFNVIENAANLLNNAFSNSVTLYANSQLATFPFAGFGIMGAVKDATRAAKFGVYQGNPQHLNTVFYRGYMALAELEQNFYNYNVGDLYSIKAGAWMYQQSNPKVAFTLNARGLYFIMQGSWQLPASRTLKTFVNFGYSDQEIKYVPYSLAGGVTITNVFLAGKDALALGIGKINIAQLSSEVAYELAYAIQLHKNLTLTPDLQYIRNPGGYLPNALIGMLRLLYTF